MPLRLLMSTGGNSGRHKLTRLVSLPVAILVLMSLFWEARHGGNSPSHSNIGSSSVALEVTRNSGCQDLYVSYGEPHVPYPALAIDCTTRGMEYSLRYYYGEPAISKVLPDWDESIQNREVIIGKDWFAIAPASLIRSLAISAEYSGPFAAIPDLSQEFTQQEMKWSVCSNSLYFYIEKFALNISRSDDELQQSEQFAEFEASFPGTALFISNHLAKLSATEIAEISNNDELANRDLISLFDPDIKAFCNR